ncbi:MAG TPA: metallophosphoesterase, partial [Polyangiaceae bacterium]
MKSRFLILCTASLFGLTGCPSDYAFKLVSGQAPVNARRVIGDLAKQAAINCNEGLKPYVHCESEPLLCRSDPLTRVTIPDGICNDLQPLLTFVHTSDAQLKEDQVALDGPLRAGVYDGLEGANHRDAELERYDFAVFLATMLSVNSLGDRKDGTYAAASYAPCPPPLPPSFVLHTGNAIDAGMFSELFEFLAVVHELEVPFFNAVGNHDNLFFGTFPKGVMGGADALLPFVPLGDTDRFLRAHGPDRAPDDFAVPHGPGVVHPETRLGHALPPALGTPPAPYFGSDYSGFDLFCPTPRLNTRGIEEEKVRSAHLGSPSFPTEAGGLCTDARGYYGEDFLLPKVPGIPDRKVRLLVLNTAEVGPKTLDDALDRGRRGTMREEQYLWLDRELAGNRDRETLFLVAGHHDLDGFFHGQDGRLRRTLLAEPRVAAYLSGHTHTDAIHRFERVNPRGTPGGAKGEPLWEVTAGSTLVYPEFSHLVDLLERPNGETYLRVRSFRQRVSDAWCGSDCDLKYLAARGRTGAFNDNHDGDWRLERE